MVNLEFSLGTRTIKVESNNANINITSLSSQKIIVYEPTVENEGKIECAFQGGFPQDNRFFYAMPTANNDFSEFVPVLLNGTFTLKFLYSSGIMLTQINSIEDIQSYFLNETTSAWWNTRWEYRMKLNLNNSWLKEDLFDFPILVNLTRNCFDFSKTRADGADIRFTSDDGITLLSYETETWDFNGEHAEFWVLLPKISGTGTFEYIYLYYGNPDAENAENPNFFLDANYIIVDHFLNSSFETPTRYFQGSPLNSIKRDSLIMKGGKVGAALHLNGVSDYVTIQSDSVLASTEFTLEVWVKPISVPSYSERLVERGSPWDNGWRIEI